MSLTAAWSWFVTSLIEKLIVMVVVDTPGPTCLVQCAQPMMSSTYCIICCNLLLLCFNIFFSVLSSCICWELLLISVISITERHIQYNYQGE